MIQYFQSLSRRDIFTILAFVAALSCLSLWRAGEIGISTVLFAILVAILTVGMAFTAPFLLAWAARRIGLIFGVQLGDWGSTRRLKAFIAARDRRLAQLGGRNPLAGSRTKFLLGLALGELGTRETDIDALRQSAEAFREALPALRAAGKNSKWALTQNNLAVTLLHLSRRELGTKSLEEAEAALRAAAEYWESVDNKADWADVQWHRCAVLAHLGLQEDGSERLAEAVAAGRAALAAEDNKDVPLADARLQINLASALACLGERETGSESLEEAVAMARDSLRVIVEDKHDLLDKDESIEWRAQQLGNLGLALRCLGARRDDVDMLRDAVETLQSTTPLRTDKNAHVWAVNQDELACALHALCQQSAKPDLPSESLSASDAALGVLTRDAYPFDWAVATATRANTLAALVARTPDEAALRRAVGDLEAALAVFEQADASVQRRHCQADLDRVRAQLDSVGRGAADGPAENSPPSGPMKPRPA